MCYRRFDFCLRSYIAASLGFVASSPASRLVQAPAGFAHQSV
jgi:hypothetical protein